MTTPIVPTPTTPSKLQLYLTSFDTFVSQFPRIVVSVLLAVILGIGIYHYRHKGSSSDVVSHAVVVQTTPTTKTITVPTATLTPKTITNTVYVQDKASANALLAENTTLKIQMQQLNETVATLQASGSGTEKTIPVTDIPKALVPAGTTATSTVIEFQDWRLHFIQNGTNATYDLTQKFEIESTNGKNAQGVPTNLFKVYELGAKGEKLPLTDVTTVTIAATPNLPHWYVKPTLQAGVGVATNLKGVAGIPKTQAFLIGVQWLQHGSTTAPADTKWALLSPVYVHTSGTNGEVGILPISLNLAAIPHLPVTNVWVSPYVGVSLGQTVLTYRVGGFVSFLF